MKRIFCIIGKSGSGKSTLIKKLMERRKLLLKNVKSFSTRKPRDLDDLETHIFVNNDDYLKDLQDGKVLLDYYNREQNYHNYVTENSFDKEYINLFAVDIKAFREFVEDKRYSVYGIYLDIDEELRRDRLIKRDGFDRGEEKHLAYEQNPNLTKLNTDVINCETVENIIKSVWGGDVL